MSTADFEKSPTNESSSTNCPPIFLPLPLFRLNYPVAQENDAMLFGRSPTIPTPVERAAIGWAAYICRRASDRLDCGRRRARDRLCCRCRRANDRLGCGRSHNIHQVLHRHHLPTHLGNLLMHIVATQDFTV